MIGFSGSFLGLDIINVEPNRVGSIDETVERRMVMLDSDTGALAVDPVSIVPRPVRPFLWSAFSRAEATALRTFLEARKGRAIPFWMPTYQTDFLLSLPMDFATSTATLSWVGYFERVWSNGQGRRHVALYSPISGFSFHEVRWSAHTTGAATETMLLDPSAPVDYPAGTVGMFLKYCRLDSDAIDIAWHGLTAEASIVARELPLEEPKPFEVPS